jgi:hypothetical protein
MIDQYYQCKLSQGNTIRTAWIEAKGAKVGVFVELLPDHTFWHVDEVYSHGLSEDVLKERERINRKGLPSIRDTKKDKKRA